MRQQVFGNRLAARLMRRFYHIEVTDLGPFRALRRRDLLALGMREMTYGWSVEMMVKAARAGSRYREVPVRYHRRIGVSKVGGTLRGSTGRLVHPLDHLPLRTLDAAGLSRAGVELGQCA